MAIFTHQRHSYEIEFANKFDNEFENWFGNLARRLHPGGNCQPIRLTQGDGKIDVYVLNEQIIYQCYGPQTFKPKVAANKISKDFWGAYGHLDGEFKKWIFVHNHRTGLLDKESLKAINNLITGVKAKKKIIQIQAWGKEDLWGELENRLSYSGLQDLFGAPNPVALDYESLESVLISLEKEEYQPSLDTPSLPDVDKLDFNKLGPSCRIIIEMGRYAVHKVVDYFSRCPNPEFGEQLAERFRRRYQQLKAVDRLSPDEIFNRLQLESGWKVVPDAKRQLAMMTILSYFFHQCDIFENIPAEK